MFEKFFPALKKKDAPVRSSGPRDLFELMEAAWSGLPAGLGGFPAVDVSETEAEVVVRAEIPGLDKDDMRLTLENDRLVIQGEKRMVKEEKGEKFHRLERSYGAFHRSVPLPARCLKDRIKAAYRDGVLDVRLPKDESCKPRRVEIES